jgi:uncharacterized protein YjbJ (UPF0337 family)
MSDPLDSTQDRIEGNVDEVKGRAKQAAGDITGDSSTRAEGKVDESKGKTEKAAADVKDKAEDLKDKISG